MEAKALVRYFYEVVVSEYQMEKLPAFVDEQCVWTNGEEQVQDGIRYLPMRWQRA